MSERVPGKLGKLAAVKPAGLHHLASYQSTPFPEGPEEIPVPTVDDWRMLANDHYGNCTFAGIVHARMANADVLEIPYTAPSDDEVVKEYLEFTNGEDKGAVVADLLKHWQTKEVFDCQLKAYAPSDKADFVELKSIIAALGFAYVGVQLPVTYADQFRANQPWTLTGTPADNNLVGGHCIILVGYNKDYVYSITWGKVQAMTWEWLQSYLEESWALITPEVVEKGKYGSLDLDRLLQDIGNLG